MVEGTDFRIEIDGYNAVVKVNPRMRSEATLLLAGKGLGRIGERGFTIFLDFDSSTTSLEKEIMEIEAKKSELRRMIRAYKEVEDVQISFPRIERSQSDCGDEISQTAGVVLTLRPGKKLTDDQLTAVRYLIAGVFPGLSPENISMTDQTGRRWDARYLYVVETIQVDTPCRLGRDTPPPRGASEAAGPVSRSPSEATIASMQPAEMPR